MPPRSPRSRTGRIVGSAAAGAQARIRELTAELDTMRTQMTDLRLREAMTRTRVQALQAEVERLNALLEAGLLGRIQGFWRRISVGAFGDTPAGSRSAPSG
jgi:hypothetical protein